MSCIEAGAVATATVGRVGEYDATTGPGRGRLVRSLAACCLWHSSSPSASGWRGAYEVLEDMGVTSRLATKAFVLHGTQSVQARIPRSTRLVASLGLVPVH
jgi:hypothetical protein